MLICWGISLLWLIAAGAEADIIYLKDGTKVRAAKVWEEGDVIRFAMENYEDIIITYSKEIVDRIEKNTGETEMLVSQEYGYLPVKDWIKLRKSQS